MLHATLLQTTLLLAGVVLYCELLFSIAEIRTALKRPTPYRGSVPSSGAHKRATVDGEISVCDTCTNSLGYNVAWDLAHEEDG